MPDEEDIYRKEQKEILEKVHEIRRTLKNRGRAWNRFRGDAITRVVTSFLKKYMPDSVKIVRLSWIEDCPVEFDLLVVDKDAKPIDFTGAYPKDRIHVLIEVKGSGFFVKKDELEQKIKELFQKWRDQTNKPVLYFSLWERSNDYADLMSRAVGKKTAFSLEIKDEINPGEWERFVKTVKSYL